MFVALSLTKMAAAREDVTQEKQTDMFAGVIVFSSLIIPCMHLTYSISNFVLADKYVSTGVVLRRNSARDD